MQGFKSMPVMIKKIGNKYRVVEKATGKISRTKSGKPIDGGGHPSKLAGNKQVRAINASLRG